MGLFFGRKTKEPEFDVQKYRRAGDFADEYAGEFADIYDCSYDEGWDEAYDK